MSGGVCRCLGVSGVVWPDTPSGQGLTIVIDCAPPVFFLNPCRIAHPESTCTQCACAGRSFGSAVRGWSMGGAAPVVQECSSRVVACVFGGGAPVFGVDFVCFERPFFGAFFWPPHCSQEVEGGRGVSIMGQRHPDTDQTGEKVANDFDVGIVSA